MKLTFLYPPDAATLSVHHSHALILRLLASLPKQKYRVQVVGRIPKSHFRRTTGSKLPYLNLFDHPAFDDQPFLPPEQVEHLCHIPINQMLHASKRRWGWELRHDAASKVSPYLQAWQTILSDTDILMPTIDNLFFVYTAESIARKRRIPFVRLIRGRLVDNTLVFWDEDCNPIHTEPPAENNVMRAFMLRLANKSTVPIDKAAFSSESDLIKKAASIPYKATMLFAAGDPHDIDIPAFHDKYATLIYRTIRMRLYPHLHSTLFENPMPDERYVLFPLHYEWEANLPYREPFLDQVRLARIIATSLPQGTFLYIKPHPHYRNADQPFLQFLKLFGTWNIRIIRPSIPTTDLITNSIAVIAINSTVGYEAVQMGKPVISLGHEKFGCDESVMPITESWFPDAIRSASTTKIQKQAGRNFLLAYTSQLICKSDEQALLARFIKVLDNQHHRRN